MALLMLWAVASILAPAEERGWAVFESALKRAGGRDQLAAVQDMSFELDSHVVTPQGDFDVQSKSLLILPGTVRQESTLPFGEVVMAFDSRAGWRKGPQGLAEIPAPELQLIQADLARANILFRPPAGADAARWVSEATVEGHPCDVVEIANIGGGPLRLSVDQSNGDVIRRSYRSQAPGGGLADVDEILSDFRQVSGLRLSFKVRVMRNGKMSRESVTRNLKLNTGLKAPQLLRRPE